MLFLKPVSWWVWDVEDIGHSYGNPAAAGVNVVHDWAVGTSCAKTVSLGWRIGCLRQNDFVTGIDFVDGAVQGGISSQNAPHAYKAVTNGTSKSTVGCDAIGWNIRACRSAQSVSLPSWPLRTDLDGGALLENNNPTAKIIVADPKPKFSKWHCSKRVGPTIMMV